MNDSSDFTQEPRPLFQFRPVAGRIQSYQLRSIASAICDRQELPVHRNKTLILGRSVIAEARAIG